MRASLIIWTLMAAGLCSCGQSGKSSTANDSVNVETLDSTKKERPQTDNPDLDIHTDSTYTDSSGMVIRIQNSFPRGGSYTDPNGNRFGYGIFWTRMINENVSPLELSINFPADSFLISPQSDSYLKLFLPPDNISLDNASLFNDAAASLDTMALDGASLFYYSTTDLKSYLDAGLNKPTMLKRTIHPGQECFFYIGMVFQVPEQKGAVRTGIVSKEQDLFYRISIPPFGSTLIPCGQIVLKN